MHSRQKVSGAGGKGGNAHERRYADESVLLFWAIRRWTEAQALVKRMDQDKVPYDRTTHNLLEEINIHSDMPVKALQEENVTEGFDFFD